MRFCSTYWKKVWPSPLSSSMWQPFRLAMQAVMVDQSSAIHWSRDSCMGIDVLGLFRTCLHHAGISSPCCAGCPGTLSSLCLRPLWMPCPLKQRCYWLWFLPSGELTALFVSPSCLLLNEDSSFALLRPAFHPKNINSSFQSRDIVLKAFHPPELHLLCPVRALAVYVKCSAVFHSTQPAQSHAISCSCAQTLLIY